MTANSHDSANSLVPEYKTAHLVLRASRWLEAHFRPYLGWTVLGACMAITLLPAAALRANEWIELGRGQTILELMGPMAVVAVWYIQGWRTPRTVGRRYRIRVAVELALALLVGMAIFSQLLFGWLPGVRDLWQAAASNSWINLGNEIVAEWHGVATRFLLWWQGVQAGGAAQDNLVFAGMAGFLLWAGGSATAVLARNLRQGFQVAVPSLWILGTILLYSSVGRMLMVVGLGFAVILQLVLDHSVKLQRWQSIGLDHDPGVFLDRLFVVAGVTVLVLSFAAVVPNLYVDAIVTRYYGVMAPFNQALEDFSDRLFPDVRGTSRLRGGGLAGGLPNEFLLRAGPDLGSAEVMRVRTNESAYYDYHYDVEPPPGHYMRGATLTTYDGHGWRNPPAAANQNVSANHRWLDDEAAQSATMTEGRKLVVQSVILLFNTQVLYAAPEPIEVSVDYQVDSRTPNDIIVVRGRDRSYTVVSAVPAVNDSMLRSLPAWETEIALPDEYHIHLELPDTITDRTRDVAREIAETSRNPFERAQALEAFLRTYEYDLTVPEPPDDVVDVADFFLFDLQRGYCDYYATAFVVLARLMGLPTRFSTGFAIGRWDPSEGVWVVTEAEAHSWPEVYFPQYGWIPFEPTAGRSQLTRVAAPQLTTANVASVQESFEPLTEPATVWNWQMLVWLIPLGLLVWGVSLWIARWRAGREDPWQGLLKWGVRLGRPMADGETVVEYGDGLAEYMVLWQARDADTARVVATEVKRLSRAVSDSHYGPIPVRAAASQSANDHWERLRGYMRSIQVRKK